MNQEEYKIQLMNKLSKNRYVLSFMKKNQLDLNYVEKNSDIFEEYVSNLEKCENCKGLPFCRQKMEGRIKVIYLDGKYLEYQYVPCNYHKKKLEKINHKKYYRLSDLSDSEYLIDLKTIDISQESADYIRAYVSIDRSKEEERGIYLYGQPGVGKTYLMIGLANYYAKEGKKVSFVKVPQLIQLLKDNMFESEYIATAMSHLKFSEVLFLDDIGSEAISPWTRDNILLPVLNYRMDHHLKTYFTSNYTTDELEKQYFLKGKDTNQVASKRLMERIKAQVQVVSLLGKSRR